MIIDLDGLHGVFEKCTVIDLTAGSHVVYIEGFQGSGGAAMTANYEGPDTDHEKVLMMSGRISSLYYKECDPSLESSNSPMFTICTFKKFHSQKSLTLTPWMGDAVAIGQLSYVGKGQVAVIDFHSALNFRQYVPKTPNSEFGWSIHGNLLIEQPGAYNLCISSDDG